MRALSAIDRAVVAASLTAPLPDARQISGLTPTLDRAAVRASRDLKDVAASGVVPGIVAMVYLYFSFRLN